MSTSIITSKPKAKRSKEAAKYNFTEIKQHRSPEDLKLISMKNRIKEMLAKRIDSAADACDLPDTISITYTFNFPCGAEEFRSFFRGDLDVFSTNVYDRKSNSVQVSTLGLTNYALRCPFLACAFCIRIDVDPYMYTTPAIVDNLRADPVNGFTPANDGAVGASESNPYIATQTNAVFDQGTVSNRVAYYLFNFFGIEIKLGCNDLIVDKPLSEVGFQVNAHLGICANTLVDAASDVAETNKCLLELCECENDLEEFEGKQVYLPNTDPCCGTSGAPSKTQAPIVAASSGAYAYQGRMAGCVPLARVPLMAGMSLSATIYTLPGQEDKRNEMLAMVTSGLINPSGSNPQIIEEKLVATWTNASQLNIAGPCGTVVVLTGERIPNELINFVDNGAGGYNVFTRAGHAWIGTTYVASTTTPVGVNGPFLSAPGGTAIPSASIDIETITYKVGSANQFLIRAGKLVLTFSIKGSYMSWEDLLDYLRSLASSTSKRLLMKYTAQAEVMQALLEGVGEVKVITKDGKAGVAGVEELRDALKKGGQGIEVGNGPRLG